MRRSFGGPQNFTATTALKAGRAGSPRTLNFCMNYRLIVFRAEAEQANLVISDWTSDTEPGGPIGQETITNFIEIMPWLPD